MYFFLSNRIRIENTVLRTVTLRRQLDSNALICIVVRCALDKFRSIISKQIARSFQMNFLS